MKLIDLPKFCPNEEYIKLIEKVISFYSNKEYVHSIKQIGSVSNPGISDLDFLIIIRDNYFVNDNFMSTLTRDEKYLMIHPPFCVPEKYMENIKKFTLFFVKESKINDDVSMHIALEYLLKLYITITIQLNIGIVKLRSLLLEIKAAHSDVIMFNNHYEILQDIIFFVELRNSYFEKPRNEIEIINRLKQLYNNLELFLKYNLPKYFYTNEGYFENKNISVIKNNSFNVRISKRLNPFAMVKWNNKLYFKLLNKFYSYKFYIPCKNAVHNSIIKEKFIYDNNVVNYCNKYSANMLPLKSPINF